MTEKVLPYPVSDPVELNLSFMPFVRNGGLFVPTSLTFSIDEIIVVDLQLPNRPEPLHILGKVIWITPPNALHHVLPGIGIQFTGPNAPTIRSQIEANLDTSLEIGGYTYGILGDNKKEY